MGSCSKQKHTRNISTDRNFRGCEYHQHQVRWHNNWHRCLSSPCRRIRGSGKEKTWPNCVSEDQRLQRTRKLSSRLFVAPCGLSHWWLCLAWTVAAVWCWPKHERLPRKDSVTPLHLFREPQVCKDSTAKVHFIILRERYIWTKTVVFIFSWTVCVKNRGARPSIEDDGGLSVLERAMEMGAITDEELFLLLAECA